MQGEVLTLPNLQGTEKQVKWANDIRSPVADKCRAMIAVLQDNPRTEPWQIESSIAIIQGIFNQPELLQASWWIMSRSGSHETYIENEILVQTRHAKEAHGGGSHA